MSEKKFENIVLDEILRQENCPDYVMEIADKMELSGISAPFADYDAVYKKFKGVGDKHPGETISRVNKAVIREKVIKKVKKEVFKKGLPYIHLAYFPKGFQTVGTFRVDCDRSDKPGIFNVFNHAVKHSFPMTWFIEVEAQESFIDDISKMSKDGQDIQLHCYKHITFDNYNDNKSNILKGKNVMELAGIEIYGFASPFGKWNPSLNRVMEDMKFLYSSEFGIGYDDFPFYPMFDSQVSKVLQIPVHPVCMGSLRDAGFTSDEMIHYFERIIRQKYDRNLPIMLYGHPKNEIDQFPGVVDFILSKLKSLPDIWITTYTDFAKWWQKRLSSEYSVIIEKNFIHISTQNTDGNLQLRLENQGNHEAFLPLVNSKITLKDINWSVKTRDEYTPLPDFDNASIRWIDRFVERLFSMKKL